MHWEELWTGGGFGVRLVRTLLTPVSWLYAAGWECYLGIYRFGLKKAREPHSPVVCVGNLQVGGTGKTPSTINVADVLDDIGRKVVISCSGYGSAAAEGARLAPEGPLKASEWGDEAALIRWLRPEVSLIVGRRRVLAAEVCHRHFGHAVLLMDDGFQHLPLTKHVTILLDPPQPNRRCLPAGPYREPRGNRGRADLVISHFGLNLPPPGTNIRQEEGGQSFRVEVAEMRFQKASGESVTFSPRSKVSVLCALGRPQGFLDALRGQGLTLDRILLRPDHDPLIDGKLLNTVSGPLVVTEKDWVKLRERPDATDYDIVIASHEAVVEPRREFRDWLQAKLNVIPHEKA